MASSIFHRTRDDVRYVGVALALKLLGSTAVSRRAYRRLGNRYGQKRHAAVNTTDVRRGQWLCDVVRSAGLDRRTFHALELGTGWTHFYGIFLRLFFDVRLSAFDVQDNRQFGALQTRFTRVLPLLEEQIADRGALERAKGVVAEIQQAISFEDLYQRLGIDYVVEESGRLDQLPSKTFDLVFSVDVMEHIPADALEGTVSSIARVLRPGGVSAHQIGLDDHLNHYVALRPDKQYLRYGDRVWRLFFENRLQYFNRMQMSDFGRIFKGSGLELVKEEVDADDGLLGRHRVSAGFNRYDARDLEAVRGFIVHRKG